MATEVNFNKDDEDENTATGGAPADAAAGGMAGAGGATAATPAGARPTTPSGRPNIKQYLNANQGAGQSLAGGIQSKTQAKASQVDQGINEGRTQLQASTNPLESKLGEEGQNVIKTAFRDPSQILQQQDQLNQFNQLKNKGYAGDISNINSAAQQKQAQLQGQVGQVTSDANLAGTEGGRSELLRNTFGQPNYTRGQQKLDQLFLQAQPGVAKDLQSGLQGLGQQSSQNLAGLSSEAQAKINALTGLSDQRAQQWQDLYSGGENADALDQDLTSRGVSDIDANSQKRLAQGQADVAWAAGARERLANNQATQEDIDRLQLQDVQGKSLYDTKINKYLNQEDRQATMAGTADPAEVARYRALQQLSGGEDALFGGAQNVGDFKAYDFDKNKLTSDLSSTKQKYEVGDINSMIDQMRSSGYFGGASSGGGMRSADPGAIDRQNTGRYLTGLQQGLAAGQITPEDYYNKVEKTLNDVWGKDRWAKSGLYKELATRGNTARTLRPNQLATVAPTAQAAPTVNWDEVAASLAKKK